LSGKWLELLKQIAPGVTRAAVIRQKNPPPSQGEELRRPEAQAMHQEIKAAGSGSRAERTKLALFDL
jgi:hypothetical protein